MHNMCSLLETGKEKRNENKIIPPKPVYKDEKKVAALLRKPSWPTKHEAEPPRRV